MTPTASPPDCDVVIVNYNAGKLLTNCVSSVLRANAARVIVVDNGSTDDSLECLERVIPSKKLSLLRNHQNLGFAVACNIGARVSSASHLLFLNPDGVLTEHGLARMIEVLDSSPTIGMVGGFLCNPDGSEQAGGRRSFPTPQRAFLRAFGLSRLARFFPEAFSDFLQHAEPLPSQPAAVEAISGACMLVKRAAINDVGLWDEGYFLHCEDLDWCMRFAQRGWKVMFVPDAKVVHVRGACGRNRPLFVEWHKHHGMLRFYRKFYHHQYPGLLWGLVVAGVWMRFIMVASYHGIRYALVRMGIGRG